MDLLFQMSKKQLSALKKIPEIDRQFCRNTVEERFTVEKMVDNYIKVYQQIINRKIYITAWRVCDKGEQISERSNSNEI